MINALLGPRPPVRKRLMLTREELHLLLNAPMRRPNTLAIRILLATGVRGGELFTAKWKDVHLDEAQRNHARRSARARVAHSAQPPGTSARPVRQRPS